MVLAIVVLLAFGAGLLVRSFMDRGHERLEIEQGYGAGRFHSYD